ncbi:MAG: hypothetical protein JSR33_10100 [Proteobacteria bacterium]|nr:hypothetical protein [Pseudomonadota bacterium]
MIQKKSIPTYIYGEGIQENSLLQGDVLKVQGQFSNFFKQFYPEVSFPDHEDQYVMVLTQSCDLVKSHKRKPKVSHINVCLIRTLRSLVRVLISEEIKPLSIAGNNILEREANDRLKDKLSKLLNNSDQKLNFFLPMQSPFTEDMVAMIPLSFSFRIEHYNLLAQNKVLVLKPEFQAKVGYIISELYGRVGTPDLSDFGWNDKSVRDYINTLLHDLNLIQVPDSGFLQYIEENWKDGNTSIHELIEKCDAKNVADSFQPIRNELKQNLKTQLIRLFEDKEKIDTLKAMEKKDLAKEIVNILNNSGL